jgi:hypothetical protein
MIMTLGYYSELYATVLDLKLWFMCLNMYQRKNCTIWNENNSCYFMQLETGLHWIKLMLVIPKTPLVLENNCQLC